MLKPHDQRKKFGSVGTPVLGFEIKIIDEKGYISHVTDDLENFLKNVI